MVLQKWNKYLNYHDNSIFLEKKNSTVGSIIDYFSAPNLLDIFNLGGDFSYNNNYFNLLINNSVLLNSDSIVNIQSFDNFYNINTLDYKSLLNTYPIESLDLILNDIKLITPINSDLNN